MWLSPIHPSSRKLESLCSFSPKWYHYTHYQAFLLRRTKHITTFSLLISDLRSAGFDKEAPAGTIRFDIYSSASTCADFSSAPACELGRLDVLPTVGRAFPRQTFCRFFPQMLYPLRSLDSAFPSAFCMRPSSLAWKDAINLLLIVASSELSNPSGLETGDETKVSPNLSYPLLPR